MIHGMTNRFTGTMMLAVVAGQAAAAPGEIRVVDRVLLIEGLDDPSYNDRIEVVEDGLELWVRAIGSTIGGFRVPIVDVDEIKVALWSGNDTFQAPDLDLPMIVDGGYGNDHIHTGRGDDTLFGRDGNDTLSGNEGDDYIVGGDWADTIYGGPGNDTIYGFYPVANASDILFCHQDDDTIDAGPGSDYVEGGPYNDVIHAGDEDFSGFTTDTVYGFVNTPDASENLTIDPCEDKDTITVTGGSLIAYAGPDDDMVYGADFDDVLSGDSGDDVIYAYGSSDILAGGPGDDFIDCGKDDDTAEGGPDNDEIWGRDGNDTLKGNTGIDYLFGENGEDTLNGGDDTDFLEGGPGDDTLKGGNDLDWMYGQDGNDNMHGFQGDDLMWGGEGDDTMWGNAGQDTMAGGGGNDRIDGGSGGDLLFGESGDDELIGGVTDSDNDTLYGGDDHDRLYGGGGEDTLSGGNGDDLLVAVDDDEDDTLTGGSGFDSFWYDKDRRDTDSVTDATSEEEQTNVHEVKEFRNGADYTWDGDNIDELEAGVANDGTELEYQSYSGLDLFAPGGPKRSDINQANLGTCWLLAALAAIAEVNDNAIHQTIIPLPDGTFMLEWGKRHYREDADLPTKPGSSTPFYTQTLNRETNENTLWAVIIEKMVADAEMWGGKIFKFNEYVDAEGGWPSKAFRKMDGNNRTLFELIITAAFEFHPWGTALYLESQLRDGKAVAFCTRNTPDSAQLVGNHCYMVMRVLKTRGIPTHIELYNPWAVDGGSAADTGPDTDVDGTPDNDGIIWISVNDFYTEVTSSLKSFFISDFSAFDK